MDAHCGREAAERGHNHEGAALRQGRTLIDAGLASVVAHLANRDGQRAGLRHAVRRPRHQRVTVAGIDGLKQRRVVGDGWPAENGGRFRPRPAKGLLRTTDKTKRRHCHGRAAFQCIGVTPERGTH